MEIGPLKRISQYAIVLTQSRLGKFFYTAGGLAFGGPSSCFNRLNWVTLIIALSRSLQLLTPENEMKNTTLCVLFSMAFVPMAFGQESAGQIQALKPEIQTAKWAEKWWMPRHEQKLKELKEMEKVDLLFIGDSITHGFESGGKAVWDKFYAPRKAFNIGYSGDRTEHVIWRLQNGEVEGISPKLAVIMIGTNNTGHRKDPPKHTAAGIQKIIEELQARLGNTKILLLGIFPRDEKPDGQYRVINDGVNRLIKGYASEEKGIYFLDISNRFLDKDGKLGKSIMPDLLHPNAKGYAIWAEAIEPTVEKLMGS